MLQASHQNSRSPHCQQRRLQHWILMLHSPCTTLQQASPSGHSRTGRSRPRACLQRMQHASLRQAPAKARRGVLFSTIFFCSWPSARSALLCPAPRHRQHFTSLPRTCQSLAAAALSSTHLHGRHQHACMSDIITARMNLLVC